MTARRRVGDIFLAALAIALVTGMLHGLVSWMRRVVLHDLLRTYMSPDVAWMSPIGYCVLLLPVAALLAVVAVFLPRMPALRVAAFVFGTLGAFSFLLLFPRLHQYAALALALGIGVRLAVTMAKNPDRWRRRLSRTAWSLAALTLVFWGWQSFSRGLHERRTIAALPAAPAGAPNVLFLILDTVRASSLGLYGAQRATTPKLDELAKSGTVFDWAFSTAPWTLPSHASMFTGRYSSQHTGDWTSPLDARFPTIAEVFSGYGYATAGFTANLVATPRGFGLDRGFSRYEDHRRSLGQIVLSTSLGQAESLRQMWEALVGQRWIGGAVRALARFNFEPRYSYPDNDPKVAPEVAASFLRWRRDVGDRPYFAFLNFFDAHGPYDSPARYDTIFGRSDRVLDKYERAIRYLDDELAILFDSLRAEGSLDRTIVILTSDHGEQFGEHGLGWHSNSLYEQLVHVPLFIRYPAKVPAGARVARQVSLRDLSATMMDLAGLPDRRGIAGASLATTWMASGGETSEVLAELSRAINSDAKNPNSRGDMLAVADDSLHYIRNGDGTFELYAYRRDPREEHDLAKGPHASLAPAFETRATAALGGAQAPHASLPGTPR